VEKHLDGVDTVLIAPDGELSGLPFAALPGKKPGTFLLEEYTIGYLTSGRQLLGSGSPERPVPSGLLALGGADYGKPAGGETSPAWRELPGTEVEARRIEAVFRSRFPDAPVRRLSGRQADRGTLLTALEAKRRFGNLHLATHGYFEPERAGVPPAVLGGLAAGAAAAGGLSGMVSGLAAALVADEPGMLDSQRGLDPSGRGYRIERNPMVLTGLVLAGCNRAGADGLLTAEEIAGLDLRGCDLVVLSACETGLGKLAGWQGVQGLQRAFHEAGAGSLVASLWSVSDAATSVLMEHFYRHLWEKKQPPLQALRQAQLFVLKHPQRVQERAAELHALLVKRVSEEALTWRGIGRKALALPAGSGKVKRSPVAWWAAWVLSGVPAR
jgi:CHAT domain-containing protein